MCKLILTYIDVSVPYTRSNTKFKLSLSVFYSPWALVTWSLGFLVFLSLILEVVLSSNFYFLSSTVLGLWALGHWDSYSAPIPNACSNTKLKLLLPVFYRLWALVTWTLEFLVFLSLILLVVLSSKFYYLSSTVLGFGHLVTGIHCVSIPYRFRTLNWNLYKH